MHKMIIASILASGFAASSCKDQTSAPAGGPARPNLRAKPGNDLPAAMMSDLDPALARGRIAAAKGRRSLPTEVMGPSDEAPTRAQP